MADGKPLVVLYRRQLRNKRAHLIICDGCGFELFYHYEGEKPDHVPLSVVRGSMEPYSRDWLRCASLRRSLERGDWKVVLERRDTSHLCSISKGEQSFVSDVMPTQEAAFACAVAKLVISPGFKWPKFSGW